MTSQLVPPGIIDETSPLLPEGLEEFVQASRALGCDVQISITNTENLLAFIEQLLELHSPRTLMGTTFCAAGCTGSFPCHTVELVKDFQEPGQMVTSYGQEP